MIKLLDGKSYDNDWLISEAKNDDFYYGFLSKTALSSSLVTNLLNSPVEYWKSINEEQKDTSAFLVGGAIHMALLESWKVPEFYTFSEVTSRNAKAHKELVEKESRKVLTKPEWDLMADIEHRLSGLDVFTDRLSLSETEVPAIGEIFGVPFRGKADMLDIINGKVYDLKTTSSIKDFKRSAYKYNYDAQCYIYCQLFEVDYQDFEFLVIDKNTKEFGVFRVTEESYNRGGEKVKAAIEIYNRFFLGKEKDEIEEGLEKYVIEELI